MASKDEEMASPGGEGPSLTSNLGNNETDREEGSPSLGATDSRSPSPSSVSGQPKFPQRSNSPPLLLPEDTSISPKDGAAATTATNRDSKEAEESSDVVPRRMVAAEEEEEPVAAAPITPPPPLPPPAVPLSPLATPPNSNRLTPSPMVVHKAIPEELLLQRSLHLPTTDLLSGMERHSPSPLRVSNPVSPKDQSSPGPCLGRSPSGGSDEVPLDFSMKAGKSARVSVSSRESVSSPTPPPEGLTGDSPLDLSVPRRRKESSDHHHHRPGKVSKLDCPSPVAKQSSASSPWSYSAPKSSPGFPAGLKVTESQMNAPLSGSWNGLKVSKGGHHHHHRGASSLSAKQSYAGHSRNQAVRGQHSTVAQLAQSVANAGLSVSERGGAGNASSSSSKPGRQNPWQTQWMSKSSEQSKAVFTCVFCQEPCMSLAEMTLHMKKSPNCGKAAGIQASIPSCLPRSPVPTTGGPGASVSTQSGSTVAHAHASGSGTSHAASSATSGGGGSGATKTSSSAASSSSNALQGVKESMPLPRKLVRGQDVWLGKGAEQTRQILKCMWCGQSFKTLADMTTHMRVTQHYTNIISQEQIISWRTPEDKVAAQSQVNAVLTCKVCDQAFGSLKELSYHMVKNSHYKEHILRSISEGGGRRRQTRERRKKSLPVRKLLELERMEMNKQGGASGSGQNHSSAAEAANASTSSRSHHLHSAAALAGIKVEPAVDGKITCEECAEKVDAKDFVRHIKKCSGQRNHQANLTKVKTEPPDDSGGGTASALSLTTTSSSSAPKSSSPDAKKTLSAAGKALLKDGRVTASPADDAKTDKGATDNSCDSAESTSVLNAIERLIEKSFEHKGRRGAASTGILQRLGIDEEVYPPWHPASSPGKMTPSSDGGRAKSTSPLRINCNDPPDSVVSGRGIYDGKEHSHHLYENFNHVNMVGCGSETSRGSTPASLMNTLSPARSLTMSPHRTHSSMTGSTSGGSPPPSPHSAPTPSPSPSLSSLNQQALLNTKNEISQSTSKDDEPALRSPKSLPAPQPSSDHPTNAHDQDTDIEDDGGESESRAASPMASHSPTPPKSVDNVSPAPSNAAGGASSSTPLKNVIAPALPDRPSRSSSVSSFEDGGRTRTSPVSDSDASLRPVSSAEEQPLELVKSSSSGATKRKKSSRHHHHRKNYHQTSSSTSRKRKNSETGATDQLGADHPLRELQKLLDKTDAHLSRPPAAIQHNAPGPGSILAFSWACNDVSANSDSLMKCAFCETHFISKGAYRHHLSKMHFVKEAGGNATSGGSNASASTSSERDNNNQDGGGGGGTRTRNGTESSSKDSGGGGGSTGHNASSANASQPLPSSINDESTHSKFLKYTELAKQLSSKYV